jgi:hypothetical protein
MATNNSTNTAITVGSTGEINYPKQPCFIVVNNADQTNVTGDGTIYTVQFANTIVDQNSNWDGTSTFTAPVTGNYQFNYLLYASGIDGGMTNDLCYLQTTAATYRHFQLSMAPGQYASGGIYVFYGSALANMTAGDTAIVVLRLIHSGLTVTLQGATNSGIRSPYFGGFLVS